MLEKISAEGHELARAEPEHHALGSAFGGKTHFNLANCLVGGSIVLFLIYKLANLTFRFGDGDAYFYMVQNLIHGVLPYKDFFIADPPVFILFLALLKPIFLSHWLWYQAVPIGLEIINAGILYGWLKPKFRLAAVAVPIYLFSFTVLGTSDFSTGVQLTILLSLLGWMLWEKNYPKLSGLAWSLSILTKLYALPAFTGFLIYLIWKKHKVVAVLAAVAVTGVVVLLPFFIASPQGFIQSIILHQFHRPPGNGSLNVWVYFLKHEWAIIVLGLLGAILKSNRRYLPAFLLTALFFILFRDLYYLYLAYLFVYLILFTVSLFDYLWQDTELRPLALIASLVLGWSILGGWLSYRSSVLIHGRFLNVMEISEYLKTQNFHQAIYGSHEVAPLLALLSDKKLFNNIVDTNSQVFAAHTLDLEQTSKAAVAEGVYLIARITDLPEYNIRDVGYEGYFSPEVFAQNCHKLKFFASSSNEQDNYIGVYDCHR